jgi:hydrogenase expression/formation protein HypD
VLGCQSYAGFVERFRAPVVITGFEPVDLLEGILECVNQLESGEFRVANRYARTVRDSGNETAQDIIDQVFEPADRPWRGMGVIPAGGLRLRPEWRRFDAERRFGASALSDLQPTPECRSGDVLAGRIKPTVCSSFGTRCTPDMPLGAPMVSSEGACAAYFRYRRAALATALGACSTGAAAP